jgi:hypothetical protein
MDKSFDTITEALAEIDRLAKIHKPAHLSNVLIEGVYDKRGLLTDALYEWHVKAA